MRRKPSARVSSIGVTETRRAGLGLSIVRAVARTHGGDVHAEPRPAGGLTVTVTLPARMLRMRRL